MLGRYARSQLLVLTSGGLVGPALLVVYYSTASHAGWMFWMGLLISVAAVLVAILLASHSARSAAAATRRETTGVLALAQVRNIVETGTHVDDQPLVTLDLHVEGPGLTPFDVRDRVLASATRLPVITGRKLAVLVDPATEEVRIDWRRSALVGGTMPAQFTLAEDGNRTYDLSGQAGPLMEIMQILKANDVPMRATIDIRSNSAVRDQVKSVVRRAAAQRVPPAAHMSVRPVDPATSYSPPPGPAESMARRLQELETRRAMGEITEAEYTAMRQQIDAKPRG